MVLVGIIHKCSRRLFLVLAAAFVLSAGCSADDWLFRPRDAALASVDAVADVALDTASLDAEELKDIAADHSESDVGRVDAGGPLEDVVVTLEDRQTVDSGQLDFDHPEVEDRPSAEDSSLMSDIPMLSDRPAPSGTRLVSAGFMTGSLPSNSGTLRLQHAGFEFGQRLCSGSLCLSGGFLR